MLLRSLVIALLVTVSLSAADANIAQGNAERLRPRQRHQGLVRNVRPG